ncbi:hypothetical protein Hanom_Chr07g00616191 [Helianthus anomalus]
MTNSRPEKEASTPGKSSDDRNLEGQELDNEGTCMGNSHAQYLDVDRVPAQDSMREKVADREDPHAHVDMVMMGHQEEPTVHLDLAQSIDLEVGLQFVTGRTKARQSRKSQVFRAQKFKSLDLNGVDLSDPVEVDPSGPFNLDENII